MKKLPYRTLAIGAIVIAVICVLLIASIFVTSVTGRKSPSEQAFGTNPTTVKLSDNLRIADVCFSRDDDQLVIILSGNSQGRILVWNTRESRSYTDKGVMESIRRTAISPKFGIIATGHFSGVKLWTYPDCGPIEFKSPIDGEILAMSFSPHGGDLMVADDSGRLLRIDMRTATVTASLLWDQPITCVTYSPSGDSIVIGDLDGHVIQLSINDLAYAKTIGTHSIQVTGIAFLSDTTLASTSIDGSVTIWDVKQSTVRRQLRGSSEGSKSLSLDVSGDGLIAISGLCYGQNLLATVNDEGGFFPQLTIWNASTGEKIHDISGDLKNPSVVRFSSSGSRLAVGSSDSTLRTWEIPDAFRGSVIKTP